MHPEHTKTNPSNVLPLSLLCTSTLTGQRWAYHRDDEIRGGRLSTGRCRAGSLYKLDFRDRRCTHLRRGYSRHLHVIFCSSNQCIRRHRIDCLHRSCSCCRSCYNRRNHRLVHNQSCQKKQPLQSNLLPPTTCS